MLSSVLFWKNWNQFFGFRRSRCLLGTYNESSTASQTNACALSVSTLQCSFTYSSNHLSHYNGKHTGIATNVMVKHRTTVSQTSCPSQTRNYLSFSYRSIHSFENFLLKLLNLLIYCRSVQSRISPVELCFNQWTTRVTVDKFTRSLDGTVWQSYQ